MIALYENGSFSPQTFNFEDFIKEAKIVVRNIGGKLVALVIGKQGMAFGVDTTKMPIPTESPVHNLVVQNEAIGFTVALEQDFNFFDKVELSGFETKAGDPLTAPLYALAKILPNKLRLLFRPCTFVMDMTKLMVLKIVYL